MGGGGTKRKSWALVKEEETYLLAESLVERGKTCRKGKKENTFRPRALTRKKKDDHTQQLLWRFFGEDMRERFLQRNVFYLPSGEENISGTARPKQ